MKWKMLKHSLDIVTLLFVCVCSEVFVQLRRTQCRINQEASLRRNAIRQKCEDPFDMANGTSHEKRTKRHRQNKYFMLQGNNIAISEAPFLFGDGILQRRMAVASKA